MHLFFKMPKIEIYGTLMKMSICKLLQIYQLPHCTLFKYLTTNYRISYLYCKGHGQSVLKFGENPLQKVELLCDIFNKSIDKDKNSR